MANLIELLQTSAKTREEFAEAVGVQHATCSRWLALFEARKCIYVAYWTRHGTNWVACWTWGYGMTSVPKPKRLTVAQVSKNARARKRRKNESFSNLSC